MSPTNQSKYLSYHRAITALYKEETGHTLPGAGKDMIYSLYVRKFSVEGATRQIVNRRKHVGVRKGDEE